MEGCSAFYAIPVIIRPDFLGEEMARKVLNMALEAGPRMKPAKVGVGNVSHLNPAIRSALYAWVPKELSLLLEQRIRQATPEFTAALGMPPFNPAKVEINLLAYSDGGFYRRHLDTATGPQPQSPPRRLTAVYYFHQRPQQFGGGDIRLFPIRGDQFMDLSPSHDQLVVFPSWQPHEVLPITVPSGDFADSRFAISFWMR